MVSNDNVSDTCPFSASVTGPPGVKQLLHRLLIICPECIKWSQSESDPGPKVLPCPHGTTWYGAMVSKDNVWVFISFLDLTSASRKSKSTNFKPVMSFQKTKQNQDKQPQINFSLRKLPLKLPRTLLLFCGSNRIANVAVDDYQTNNVKRYLSKKINNK